MRPSPGFRRSIMLTVAVGLCSFVQTDADSTSSVSDRLGHGKGSTTTQPAGVVDDRLVKELLGGKSSAKDTLESTLDHMDQAAQRLTEDLDPGKTTLRHQKEILQGLDQLIDQAVRNRLKSAGKRQMRRRNIRPRPKRQPGSPSGSTRSTKKAAAPKVAGGANAGSKKSKSSKDPLEKMDLARRWGHLPQHDRVEISQGYGEVFLPRFREQIQNYYRRLADQKQRE